jgi:hypothetical protein
VSFLRDWRHKPYLIPYCRAGLQAVPSPFDKLRAGSAGLLRCGFQLIASRGTLLQLFYGSPRVVPATTKPKDSVQTLR